MKTNHITQIALLIWFSSLLGAVAQGTAFTYQGRLNDGANPANGSYDFRFGVYDADDIAVGGPLTNAAVAVSNGLFTVTLDFGSGVFTGAGRWLKIGVRTNGGGAFVSLTPPQPLTATPYAVLAGNLSGVVPGAGLSGTYSGAVNFNNAANQFTGNGSGLTGVNATLLDGLDSSAFWQLNGNSGTIPGTHFVGTTDNRALELKVNNARALRLEPTGSNSVNVVGGASVNSVRAGVVGATIAGGGAGDYYGMAYANRVEADFGTIGGGQTNTIQALAGGATIGGGVVNTIHFNAYDSTIGGGYNNTIETNAPAATIAGGSGNTIETNAQFATISGGAANRIQAYASYATISGGWNNWIERDAFQATIAGGYQHTIEDNASGSFIGGGAWNVTTGPLGVVPGGYANVASTNSFAAGYRAKANHAGSFVWADDTAVDFSSTTNKQFAIRANNGVTIQATNTALDLRGGGALRVAGAGLGSSTPVFIHRATGANITGNYTTIDHPHCNNNPNAILIITPNWNPGGAGGTYNNHSIGVYYTGTRWAVFNQDAAAMPTNAAFNVLVFKP